MAVCAVCRSETEVPYTCRVCGRTFSPSCGDLTEDMCDICLAEEGE